MRNVECGVRSEKCGEKGEICGVESEECRTNNPWRPGTDSTNTGQSEGEFHMLSRGRYRRKQKWVNQDRTCATGAGALRFGGDQGE